MNTKKKASAALALKMGATVTALITLGFAFAESAKLRVAHERPAEVAGAVGMPLAFGMLSAAAGVFHDASMSKLKVWLLLGAACVAILTGAGNLILQKPQINNVGLGITTAVFSSLYPRGLATVGGLLTLPVILTSVLEFFSSTISTLMADHPEGRAFNDALLPLAFTLLATAHARQEFDKTDNLFNKTCSGTTVFLIAGVCLASFASSFTPVSAPIILAFMAAASVGFSMGGAVDFFHRARQSDSGDAVPLINVATVKYDAVSPVSPVSPLVWAVVDESVEHILRA